MRSQLKTKEAYSLDTESIINLDKFDSEPLATDPYEHVIVSDFISRDWTDGIMQDYPKIQKGGSFPLSIIKYGANFEALIAALDSPEFRAAVEKKFSVDLEGKPSMFTVRGKARAKDGKIHTDTESKIISLLLYMNHEWENQGGKLRLLRSNDINDVATEVSPTIGTLLVFKRSNNSWHGHLPFVGDRKVIQMNWVTHQKFIDREKKRHKWSSVMKLLGLSY
jgi:hypothetical protein